MLNEADNNGDEGSTQQNSVDWILEVFQYQFPKCLDLWWWERVWAEDALSFVLTALTEVNNTSIDVSVEFGGDALGEAKFVDLG